MKCAMRAVKGPLIQQVQVLPRQGSSGRVAIPTVKDRVVQAAVKLVLEPIFEPDFTENAYGSVEEGFTRRSALDCDRSGTRRRSRGDVVLRDALQGDDRKVLAAGQMGDAELHHDERPAIDRASVARGFPGAGWRIIK